MTRKRNRRTNKKNVSLLKTTLLIGAAFLLGIGVERSSLSLENARSQIDSIYHMVRQWRETRFSSGEDVELNGEIIFFDVGQGSSTLLKSGDGSTILIDTGRYNDSSNQIVQYLNEEIGVGGEIDLLIFTHNDADHIGNGDLVLEYFQVDEVWMNGMDSASQVYSEVLDAVLESTANYVEPKRGDSKVVGSFTIDVLHPLKDQTQSNQNDESIATRISLGAMSVMQSGDISTSIESSIIDSSHTQISSEVLLLGHHGSNTSSGSDWIESVDPQIAVYQASANNSYGHPHQEVLDRLDRYAIPVYGTDKDGTIRVLFDENGEMSIVTEEE